MSALELLSAPGLWLLAGLAPVALLYVLRIRRERLRVPSTWLWAAAQRDLLARHPWKRLTRELPLLLEVLTLTALAVALARPATRGGAVVGDHVAVVIDTSASMLATTSRTDGATRFEEARRAATAIVMRLAPGADAFVVDAGRDARAITPLERDRHVLSGAIARLDAHEVEGDLESAVGLAADRLRALHGSRRIVIITDGALARDAPIATAGIDTQVVTVGDDVENAAIVRVDARRGADIASKRDEVQVFAMIESFGSRPREAYVTLSLDGRTEPVASRRIALAPFSKTPVVLSFEPRNEDDGAGLVVRMTPGDALAADDVAYVRVPAARALPVVLASDHPPSWLARALAADANVDLRTVSLAELATVNVAPDALVAVDGACPSSIPGRDVLVVAPGEGDCLGVHVGAPVEQPRITSWDTSDARLRFLTFDGVHIARSRLLGTPGRGALMRTTSDTLIADASTPGRSGTIIGFDLGESDWPLQSSFVLFVRDVVEVARSHRTQGASIAARTGEPLRISTPLGVTRVRVDPPGGEATELEAKDGFTTIPPPTSAGFVRARWVEPHVGSAIVPVNLVSGRESDIRPRPVALEVGGTSKATSSREMDAHHEWAAWLAFAASALACVELVWLTRPTARRQRPPAWALAIALCACGPMAYESLVYAGIATERYVRFGSLVGVAAVAAAGVLLSWRLALLPARMGRTRRALFAALSSSAVLAAALAASEPELGAPLDRLTVVLAVDRSRSIDLVPGAQARVRYELAAAEQSMRASDRVATLVFGAEAAVEDPPRPRSELPPPQRIEVGRDGTDIEAAIRRSLAEVPSDSAARIALITDGVETRGDALLAAAAAQSAGVPIDAVVLEQQASRDVRIVSVGAPTTADRSEPFDLRIVTSSAISTDLEIRISRDHTPLARIARAHVNAGEDVLRLREIAPEVGLHRYDVEVTALDPSADSSPEDNAASTFVRVRGPAIALVLEADTGAGAPVARALEAAGMLVEERPLSGVPTEVGELSGYDLVTLGDIRASDLTPTQLSALASYVRDLGGGLLLFGSDRSMGPGGYARTPIEEVSPVYFDLKKEKRRASLAEVIAIDYSGSMGMVVSGQTKLALANEAAARSASLLGHGDRLGVEHVDTEVRWTVPVGPVDEPEAIGARVRSVSVGGGGIYTDLALNAGYEALASEHVNLKHLLLFADGNDAEQIAGCRAIVHEASSHGITTSVISLGTGHDSPELEALSKEGGGRFYLIDDATKLPAVFTQETILAAKSAIHEDPFRVSVGAPSAATRGLDFDGAPALGGYVVTVPKPLSTIALTGPEGDPILVSWSAGLGRAGAFMSDYRDKWGAAWLSWDGAGKLFGQVARDLARKNDDPRVRLASDTDRGELHVRADVVGDDGRAQTFRRLSVHVAGPDGYSRNLPLEAIGAGRYTTSLPLSRPGTYVATAKDDADGAPVGTSVAVLERGEEMRPTGSDRAILARLTSATGGKVRDSLAGIFEEREARRFAYTALAPFFTLFAGIALVLAVAARKTNPRSGATTATAMPSATTTSHAPSSVQAPTSPARPAPTPPPRALTSAERLARKRRNRR